MEQTRRYDMDWLRVFGVYIVIPFHAMMTFILRPWAVVYIKAGQEITPFITISGIIHIFNMPLLFILAGMSVSLSLGSRLPKKFVKERINKLLIPALFISIMVNPFVTYIYLYSSGEKILFGQHIASFFTRVGDLSGTDGGFTPAQMWFVIFLFVFSLVGLPLFMKCINPDRKKQLSKAAAFFHKPFTLSLLIIPVALASAINILDDKNPIVYFLMFIIGFLLMTDTKYQEALNRDKWIYLILSIVFIVFNIYTTDYPAWSPMYIIDGLFYNASRLLSVFALIGFGNCYLNRRSKILNYLSRASFTVYAIHMLVITIVGYFVVTLEIPVILMFFIIIAGTFLLSFLFYEAAKRIGVLRFLFAIKG